MDSSNLADQLDSIYSRRLTPDRDATVIELAAGYCEFINNIQCGKQIAAEIDPDTPRYASPGGVRVVAESAANLVSIVSSSADILFCSNFLEHLTRPEILKTNKEARRITAPGGNFLILQHNRRFCAKDYWMFFDHLTPPDDRAVCEALETNGWRFVKTILRFLPHTIKSLLPKSIPLIKIYLRVPLLWRLFDSQAFIIAEPDTPHSAQART